MNLDQFKQKISNIKTVKSITSMGIYSSIQINGDKIQFIRNNNTRYERISIVELYNFFTNEKNITTSNAKLYISGRVQSPAVAILNELIKSNK